MTRVLVMADTHNRLPQNMSILAEGAAEIWHLGDVCSPHILEVIEELGPPVTVVRGNCDTNNEWPIIVDLVRSGLRFRLQHIPPERPPENVDVVLHGHTHVSRNEKRGNVLFLNPGCVTRPNCGSPPSVAWLAVAADGKIDWRLKTLR